MNKLIPYFAKPLFWVFCLVVAGAVLYYSWNALGMIFPEDLEGQLFGMVILDAAMATWFIVFMTQCKSTMQYVWSGFGFAAGLIGTVFLVGMEVGTSSGMIDPEGIAKPLTYVFVGVLLAHLLLAYSWHASSPEQAADISLGIEKAKITDEARKVVEKKIGERLHALADVIADDLLRGVLRDLRIVARIEPSQEPKAFEMIEPAKESEAGKEPGFLSQLFGWVDRGGKSRSMNAQSVAIPSSPVIPKPSPAPLDAGSEEAGEEEPKKS